MAKSLWLRTVVLGAALCALTHPALAADEPDACLSNTPGDWPASSKPYFMIAVDTSGSMGDPGNTFGPNSCGYNQRRNGGARCAVYKTVLAFSGIVNFGLMTFPMQMVNYAGTPPATCPQNYAPGTTEYGTGIDPNCELSPIYPTSDGTGCGNCSTANGHPTSWWCRSCGNGTGTNAVGANILVPLQQDNFWAAPGSRTVSNVPQILDWVDNKCGGCKELGANAWTPLDGLLRDAYRYLSTGWTNPLGGTLCTGDGDCPQGVQCVTGQCRYFPSPLGDLTTELRRCRSVNMILVTDGEETCDPTRCTQDNNATSARAAAAALLTGFTIGTGPNAVAWSVKTHVISLGTVNGVNNIAADGGTVVARVANNEAELSAALADVVSSAMPPEVCDNTDNNCNGCTDEGYKKYCLRNVEAVPLPAPGPPTHAGQCCAWGASQPARNACIAAFQASITPGNPKGSPWLLPCWNPATDQVDPQTKWLCYDPGEVCDDPGAPHGDGDNNCETDPVWWRQQPVPNTAAGDNGLDQQPGRRGHHQVPAVPDGRGLRRQGQRLQRRGGREPAWLRPLHPQRGDLRRQGQRLRWLRGRDLPAIDCGLPAPAPAFCRDQRVCVALWDSTMGAPLARGVVLGTNFYHSASHPTSRECVLTPGDEIANGCNRVDDNCNGVLDDGVLPVPCAPTAGLHYRDFPNPGDNPTSWCLPGTNPCDDSPACLGGRGPETEVCNGVDDDCDGSTDEGLGSPVGDACSSACGAGTNQCLGGRVVCVPTSGIRPEVCNGLDDDCNGVVDDNLTDAPAAPGCWDLAVGNAGCEPGQTCTHGSLTWCPPLGATCNGLGTLGDPCNIGALECDGVNGWVCRNDVLPSTEVCDGYDNNCNGQVDSEDSSMVDPGGMLGTPCGVNRAPCSAGDWVCDAGVLQCSGVVATAEVCDGIDNDCNGVVDDNLPVGDFCPFAAYDHATFPGDRSQGQCLPGQLECDPAGSGRPVCVGGTGPTAEICDGLDNDCDGQVDEGGPGPDGLDGTADPDDPTRVVGQDCGPSEGECRAGKYQCINGHVLCAGGRGPQPERCDCLDNDCDGLIDEDADPTAGEAALCPTLKTCIDTGTGWCVCAANCAGGEFDCPTPTACESSTPSHDASGSPGTFCVPPNPCGDCASLSVTENGQVVCGPAGTLDALGRALPECTCQDSACRGPCYQKDCGAGLRCVTVGPAAGNCEAIANCNYQGCDAGLVCHDGSCVQDPCLPNPCAAGEVCKPTTTFGDHRCVGSCATVTCSATQICTDGACVDTGCANACPAGQYCRLETAGAAGASGAGAGATYACADSLCATPLCNGGLTCNPYTGQCTDDPCAGVVCPAGQYCNVGECRLIPEATGGAGGEAGAATGGNPAAAGSPAVGGGTHATGGRAGGQVQGDWGLATGGGGCACRAAPSRGERAATILLALGLLAAARGRRQLRVAKGGAR